MMRSIFLAMMLLISLCASAHACPNCKDQIGKSDAQEAAAVPAAFNNSIYIMLAGLFLTAGVAGFYVVKVIRQSDRQALAAAQQRSL
jgi:hypothetical protein